MARYTVELRDVIRVAETQAHGKYVDFEYTDATWKALGLDSYPIYDETHRDRLNSMICDHFYMREIGAETVALFRLFVRRTMNEIMPYYNELYKTAELIRNPLDEIDVTRTEGWEEGTTGTSDSTGSTTVSSNSSNTYSDTPMSMVQEDGGSLIEGGAYATTATFDKSSTTNQSNANTSSEGSREGSRTETERGHRSSQSQLVMEYRRAILNVDREIVESPELSECFLSIMG